MVCQDWILKLLLIHSSCAHVTISFCKYRFKEICQYAAYLGSGLQVAPFSVSVISASFGRKSRTLGFPELSWIISYFSLSTLRKGFGVSWELSLDFLFPLFEGVVPFWNLFFTSAFGFFLWNTMMLQCQNNRNVIYRTTKVGNL